MRAWLLDTPETAVSVTELESVGVKYAELPLVSHEAGLDEFARANGYSQRDKVEYSTERFLLFQRSRISIWIS